MRIIKIILKMTTILCIILLFVISSGASEAEKERELQAVFVNSDLVGGEDVEGFIDDFRETLPDGFDKACDPESILSLVGIEALVGEIIAAATTAHGGIASFFLLLIGAAVISSAPALLPKSTAKTAESAISVVMALAVFSAMATPFAAALSAAREAGEFLALLIPVFTSVTVAGGGVGTAQVQAAGMSIASSLFGGGFGDILSSVVAFGFAIALLSSLGDGSTAAISRGTRNLFAWLLGIVTTLTVATLSLQTIVSSSADSAAMRAAKYAAQSTIPVVGGAVASALSTLSSGLEYARSVIGAGAVGVMMVLLLSPLVLMLIYRFALSVATTLADFFDARVAARTFGAFRYAADSVIAAYSSLGVIYVFEIILFLKSGVAIL